MGLLFSILLFVTAFGAENAVNKALHNTQQKIDADKNTLNLPKPAPIKKALPQMTPPDFVEVTPLTPEEQFNVGERPRGGHVKTIDPEAPVKDELKTQQDYEKYKKNYKKAIIKEVERLQEN